MDRNDFELTTLPALVPLLSTESFESFHIDVRLASLCFRIPTDSEHLVSHVLPLLLRAYNDNDVRIQEEVLKRSTSVAKQLDGQITVEEKILKLQKKKELVFEGTVGGSQEAIGKLTAEDMSCTRLCCCNEVSRTLYVFVTTSIHMS
ncbi:hypothetical protein Bca4012_074635 [Brassica carinata]